MAAIALPKPKQLQRNIIIAAVSAVVIALLVAFFRRNREALSNIPFLGDATEFILGAPQAGEFKTGGINLGDGPTIITSGRDFAGKDGFRYPPTNSCGCGGSFVGPELVSETTVFHNYAASGAVPQAPTFSFDYQAPPCFPRMDWNAWTRANGFKAQAVFQLDYKGANRAAAQGYPRTPSGYFNWLWDGGYLYEASPGTYKSTRVTPPFMNSFSGFDEYQTC